MFNLKVLFLFFCFLSWTHSFASRETPFQMSTHTSGAQISSSGFSFTYSSSQRKDENFEQQEAASEYYSFLLTDLKKEQKEVESQIQTIKQTPLTKQTSEERITAFLKSKESDSRFQLKRAYQSFEKRLENYPRENPLQNEVKDLSESVFKEGQSQLNEKNFYESEFSLGVAQSLLDIGLSLTPGISLGKDAYEALSGKNLVTGDALDDFDRSLAIIGLATLGTSHSVQQGIHLVQKASKIPLTEKTISFASHIVEVHGYPLIREVVQYCKKYNPYSNKDLRKQIFKAFTPQTKLIRSSTEAQTYFRYYEPEKNLKGGWFTTQHFDDMYEAAEKLALPKDTRIEKLIRGEFTLKKGSTYLDGLAGPLGNRKGGASQIYVFDLNQIDWKDFI